MKAESHGTLWRLFEAVAARHPDRPFLNVLPETAAVYGIAPGETSFGQMRAWAERLATGYRAAGLGQGARVMVLLENRPSFVAHFLALNALGASLLPVNPDLRAAELEHMARLAEPVLGVSVPERAADLRAAGEAAGAPFPVVGPDEAPPPLREVTAPDTADLDREAAMLFTSGTTGAPKGCVLSNLYFLVCADWYMNAGSLCALRMDGERMLTPLPVFHMNALACSLTAMIAVGGCLTVLDRFHPRTWWQSVKDSGATCVHYLGVMPPMLMGLPEGPADRDHKVRFGFGAGVPRDLHAPFEERFGFPLIEAWAMTETGSAAVIAATEPPRHVGRASIGVPAAGAEARVVDDEGRDVPDGTPGELLVRAAGPDPRRGFFTRYHKLPEATEEAWAGGWFHTGDIVRRDPDGIFVFVDRKKNVIRRSGENIAAVEVEAALLRAPGVRAAAVAATPDEVRGDEVFALIVPSDPAATSAAHARGLVEWMLGQLAYYKVPGYVAFVEDLPLTGTQKIQRGVLKDLVAQLRADPATHDLRALKKRTAA